MATTLRVSEMLLNICKDYKLHFIYNPNTESDHIADNMIN
jgi:hypothetical protein